MVCDVTCDAVLQREPPCDTYQHPKRVCGAKIKIDGRVDDFFVKNGAYCHCQGAVRDGECARAWLPADNTSALNWFHHERSMYAAMFYMYMNIKKYMFKRVDVCDSDELGDFVSLSRVICLRHNIHYQFDDVFTSCHFLVQITCRLYRMLPGGM